MRFVVVLLFCALLMLVSIVLQNKPETKPQDLHSSRTSYREFTQILPDIERLWKEGPYNRELKQHHCTQKWTKKGEIPLEFMSCFPYWLDCLLEERVWKKERNNFKPEAKNLKTSKLKYLDYFPATRIEGNVIEGIAYQLYFTSSAQEKYSTVFMGSCHETYLPQRKYLDENSKRDKKIEWNNIGKILYIDQFKVSQWEINLWAKMKGYKELISWPEDVREWFKPVMNLSLDQKRSYCSFKGQKLLTSRLYNASVAIPFDLSNDQPQYIINSLDPWEKYPSQSLFSKQERQKEDIDKICTFLNLNECKKEQINPSYFNLNYPSWMGIHQVMGAEPEYFENEFFPGEVVQGVHQYIHIQEGIDLFKRDTLEGENLTRLEGDSYKDVQNKEITGTSFRCYRELVRGEE